jgi:hypothetical protein
MNDLISAVIMTLYYSLGNADAVITEPLQTMEECKRQTYQLVNQHHLGKMRIWDLHTVSCKPAKIAREDADWLEQEEEEESQEDIHL